MAIWGEVTKPKPKSVKILLNGIADIQKASQNDSELKIYECTALPTDMHHAGQTHLPVTNPRELHKLVRVKPTHTKKNFGLQIIVFTLLYNH